MAVGNKQNMSSTLMAINVGLIPVTLEWVPGQNHRHKSEDLPARLQQRLEKTGGRLVEHASYFWLLLAEGLLKRRRFGAMLSGLYCSRCRPDRAVARFRRHGILILAGQSAGMSQ